MTVTSTGAPKFALPPLPELRETKVFGRRICYYDIGSGSPLVLVHGLVLWGAEDALTPLAMAHAFHRRIAGARLRTIAQCGHLPPPEKPREFAAAVVQFLASYQRTMTQVGA